MVTVNIFHDLRRVKKNNLYPVKVRVTFDRRSKYMETGIDLSKEDFGKLSSRRISKELLDIKENLLELEAKANSIIKIVRPFNFPVFIEKFKQKTYDATYVETVYVEIINKLMAQCRVGTADNYKSSLQSLLLFKKNLRFEDISDTFLFRYETWMLERGRSITTVGIYCRCLRAIFNEAIYRKIISLDYYPFGKRKYQMPVSKNIKKALRLQDIGKIYFYQPKQDKGLEAKAKAFWLFSYFANGMNMKDIALLKFKNISDEFLSFERAKTIRSTRTNPKLITVYINDDIRAIIRKWSNWDKSRENYVFPVLKPGLTPSQQRDRIKEFTRDINDGIKTICFETGIEDHVTTYSARHSFSTVLKRSGASIEFISEALGHTDVKTTESYLDSFENEMKKEFSNSLLAFKNVG
ncbi:MAG: phage integrase SAM-like domain-containing protein [Ginsengibacter sp.]